MNYCECEGVAHNPPLDGYEYNCDVCRKPIKHTVPSLREKARVAVSYDRQVHLFGTKAAENVLQFWILGYTARDTEIKETDLPVAREPYESADHWEERTGLTWSLPGRRPYERQEDYIKRIKVNR